MGHGDWGAFAFWLFIGAIVVSSAWERNRRNAEKHQTLRLIIEKTGRVDEAKLKELFSSSNSDWATPTPGSGYRALRILGTIVMSIGAALAVFFAIMGYAEVITGNSTVIGVSAACAVAMMGLAFFLSSRYAMRLPDQGNGPPTR